MADLNETFKENNNIDSDLFNDFQSLANYYKPILNQLPKTKHKIQNVLDNLSKASPCNSKTTSPIIKQLQDLITKIENIEEIQNALTERLETSLLSVDNVKEFILSTIDLTEEFDNISLKDIPNELGTIIKTIDNSPIIDECDDYSFTNTYNATLSGQEEWVNDYNN